MRVWQGVPGLSVVAAALCTTTGTASADPAPAAHVAPAGAPGWGPIQPDGDGPAGADLTVITPMRRRATQVIRAAASWCAALTTRADDVLEADVLQAHGQPGAVDHRHGRGQHPPLGFPVVQPAGASGQPGRSRGVVCHRKLLVGLSTHIPSSKMLARGTFERIGMAHDTHRVQRRLDSLTATTRR